MLDVFKHGIYLSLILSCYEEGNCISYLTIEKIGTQITFFSKISYLGIEVKWIHFISTAAYTEDQT